MPAFDQAFAALIRDLDRTGLLDRTLVMVSSEFGRTPKINKDAGRDHWPKVFSVVLAGGGIKKGYDLRRVERDGQRARARPDRPRRPRHHGLPPARHRRRQGADGPGQPADRDRRRRQGGQGAAGLTISRSVGSGARSSGSPGIRPWRTTPVGADPLAHRRSTLSSRRATLEYYDHACLELDTARCDSPALALLASPVLGSRSLASAATPSLGAIRPVGGQRGTEIEVTLSGARLGDAKEILYYQPGITTVSLTKVDDNNVKAKLKIAPDCPLGPARPPASARRPGSASCGPSASGRSRRSTEVEPNNDFAAPQAIPMNVTVTGVADNEDVDYFVVEAKKGERISAEVEGMRLGITLFDPYVAILNAKRFELASSDDAALDLAGRVRLDPRAGGRQVHHPGARERLRRQRLVPLPAPRRQLPAADGRAPRRRQARREARGALDRRPGRRGHDRGQAAGGESCPDFGLTRQDDEGRLALPEHLPADHAGQRDREGAERRPGARHAVHGRRWPSTA